MKATIVEEKTVEINSAYDYAGVGFIEVKLPAADTFDAYRALPNLIEFQGRRFGKSCWNSDHFTAYYRTDKVQGFAKAIK